MIENVIKICILKIRERNECSTEIPMKRCRQTLFGTPCMYCFSWGGENYKIPLDSTDPVLVNGHVSQVFRYGVNDTEIRSTCLNVRLLSNDPHHGRVFYGTFFAFAFVLPMTLICALYACMIFRLLRGPSVGGGGGGGSARHRAALHGTGSSESWRVRRRVTRLVVVVVAAFGACWLPIHIVFIVQYFDAGHDESRITHTFVAVRLAANCLAYANSCLNPILYAFLVPHTLLQVSRKPVCEVPPPSFVPIQVGTFHFSHYASSIVQQVSFISTRFSQTDVNHKLINQTVLRYTNCE